MSANLDGDQTAHYSKSVLKAAQCRSAITVAHCVSLALFIPSVSARSQLERKHMTLLARVSLLNPRTWEILARTIFSSERCRCCEGDTCICASASSQSDTKLLPQAAPSVDGMMNQITGWQEPDQAGFVQPLPDHVASSQRFQQSQQFQQVPQIQQYQPQRASDTEYMGASENIGGLGGWSQDETFRASGLSTLHNTIFDYSDTMVDWDTFPIAEYIQQPAVLWPEDETPGPEPPIECQPLATRTRPNAHDLPIDWGIMFGDEKKRLG